MTPTIEDVAGQCLSLVASGAERMQADDPDNALRAFATALVATQLAPQDEVWELRALAVFNMSRLRLRKRNHEEARKLREQGLAWLENASGPPQIPARLMPLFNELMAEVLADIGEFRRAIPYCEAAILTSSELFRVPAGIAAALWRAGKCYVRVGLRDHAAVPLRAAAKMFGTLSGDPRLAAVLLDLGNALRKTVPAEAEQCYKDAAEFHVARAQLESAAPAWVNLGVLCSEQGRYVESLAYYEKALRVREKSPGTPPERMGTLLNNIANVHRRMKQFEDALGSVDRARGFLEPVGGHSLACAYGTRGLIFRDWGRDEDSVEWFRKSAAEHEKQPSPNLDTLCEELENEAAALERLGRLDEAGGARNRLDSVRASIAAIAPSGAEAGDVKPPTEGAVLIELDFGSRAGTSYGRSDALALEDRLFDLLEEHNAGYSGGRVVVPEATTLMFYGDDAEAMFKVLEPALLADPACVGARVTVRQGDQHREVMLPRKVM